MVETDLWQRSVEALPIPGTVGRVVDADESAPRAQLMELGRYRQDRWRRREAQDMKLCSRASWITGSGRCRRRSWIGGAPPRRSEG